MAEQTINPSNVNLRSKGVLTASGKLHKGFVKDATSKLSIGSIPATYESIIYRNESKNAFGSSEKRFYKKNAMEQLVSIEKSTEINCSQMTNDTGPDPSSACYRRTFNKEGSGAFVSKCQRQWTRTVKTPGPAHYYRKKEDSQNPSNRKCKTRQARMRHFKNEKQNITENKVREENPGPGYYLTDPQQRWKTANKGWKSSFQTKVDRDGYIPKSVSPGPGFYKLEEKKKKSPQKVQKAESCERNIIDMIQEPKAQEPGPGWYNHDIPNFKPLYEKIKMSRYFMTPIFESKKSRKSSPGPTKYQVKRIYEDVKPKLIQSTAFMSETKRQAFRPAEMYGPNAVSPELPSPKNFHFNIKDDWLC